MLRSGRLSAANETELSDLGVWLEHHPEEVSEDVRFQAIDSSTRQSMRLSPTPAASASPRISSMRWWEEV